MPGSEKEGINMRVPIKILKMPVSKVVKVMMRMPGHAKARVAADKVTKFYGTGFGSVKERALLRKKQYRNIRGMVATNIKKARQRIRAGDTGARTALNVYKQKGARLQRRELQARQVGRALSRKQSARRSSGMKGAKILARRLKLY